jgi:hypothetical protein
VLIDNFNTTQTLTVSGGGANPVTSSNGVATGVDAIGGNRAINLTRTSGAGVATINVNSPASVLAYGNDSDAESNATVIWDGDTNNTLNTTGLGGLSLTESGANNALRILVRSDLVVPITVTVYTDGSNFAARTVNSPGGGLPFTEFFLLFSSFTATGSPDFANVGAVTMDVSGPQSFDVQVSLLEAINSVPEPSTWGLFGLGIAALTAGRLRKR